MNSLYIISLSFIIFLNLDKTDVYTSTQQNPELEKSITRGKQVYLDMCVSCHLPNGKGIPKIYPPLANADFLLNKREESIRAVKYGMKGEITVNNIVYNNAMATLGLDDDEVADVMNYILNSWGNKNNKMVTLEEVKNISK